jgi:hypothetical protein
MKPLCIALILVTALSCRKATPQSVDVADGTVSEASTAAPDQPSDPGQIVELTPDQPPAAVVAELGKRMKLVSTLAPENAAGAAIREQYAGLASPELLRSWTREPASAPGRQVSSPWPDRVEVTDARIDGTRAWVTGVIVEQTSSGESGRVPLRVELSSSSGKWLITKWETAARPVEPDAPPAAVDESTAEAVSVVRNFYDAVNARDFERAWSLWREGGPAGQTKESFARGYADTASVRVEIGSPSRIEGAAGSRYVTIPVRIVATTDAGTTREFEGTYTLRRSVVDGATPAQRQWHIDSSAIRAR